MLVCHCNRVGNRALCDSIRHGACSIVVLLTEQRDDEPRRLFKVIVEPVALSLAG